MSSPEHAAPEHAPEHAAPPYHPAHAGESTPEHAQGHAQGHAPIPPPGVKLGGEAVGARPGPHSVLFKVLSGVITGGLLVLLFVGIIPKLTDFAGLGATIKAMAPAVVLLLFVCAFGIRILSAADKIVVIPNLSLRRSYIANDTSSAVSNVIPGPSGTAARFAVLHSWGVSVLDFTRSTFLTGLLSNVAMIAFPGVAFLILVLMGGGDLSEKSAIEIGTIAVIVTVITVVVLWAIMRSEELARKVGLISQRLAKPFFRMLHRPAPSTWGERAVILRTDTAVLLEAKGILLVTFVFGAYWLNGLLLVFCMWACGVPYSTLNLITGLALYTIGRVSTIIQITPGGVGVVEVAYTATYVWALGDDYHTEIVAAVLVYRALTYLLPIITGAFCYGIWRVMLRKERHAAAAAVTVQA